MMERNLSGLLSPRSLERACRAVRTLNDRRIDSAEGQVVAEADSLEQFGFPGLWVTIRRGAVEGRAVQAAIDTWHRRKEYRFWTPRLNDSFRFSTTRQLAEKRLATFGRFMAELEKQHGGDDLTPK